MSMHDPDLCACYLCIRERGPILTKLPEMPNLCLGDERVDVLTRFADELAKATGDGSRKRQAGTKPPWYADDSHEGAVFSHLTKWKRGELVDPDSGAHPLVHAAWRCLAIACRESGNTPNAEDALCAHDWLARNDGQAWRECWLCGAQEDV